MAELTRVHEGLAVRDAGAGVPLICPIRDEMAMLPHFLQHYRQMGVKHFIFIDNASSDESPAYLAAQGDCTVYRTEENYRQSNYAVNWINAIIELRQIEGWLLYVDIDEHLVLPRTGANALEDYCAAASAAGHDAVYAMMLDMYPKDDFLGVKPVDGVPLSETMGWFDSDYVVRPWPQRPWKKGQPVTKPQILGGPRCRLVSDLNTEVRRGALDYVWMNQIDRFIDLTPQSAMPLLARLWPAEMPALQKTPLNYVTRGFRYLSSHSGTNTRFSTELLVLLHFKFCSELQKRFEMAVVEGNHYRRGLYYLQLRDGIARANGSLMYAGSREFTGPESLQEVGLLGPASAIAWKHRTVRAFRSGSEIQRALAA
jgi:hypothetical protein